MVEIREIKAKEYAPAMKLVWQTFLQFEAETYTREGVKSFQEFIEDPLLQQMFLEGKYIIHGAFVEDEIVGVAGLRNFNHISLLFVKKQYHRMGIATGLLDSMIAFAKKAYREHSFTVNAAPYAVGFYHKYGFYDTGREREQDGVIYTPMRYGIL